jgi:hypothetical protein
MRSGCIPTKTCAEKRVCKERHIFAEHQHNGNNKKFNMTDNGGSILKIKKDHANFSLLTLSILNQSVLHILSNDYTFAIIRF